jgi:ankyrin repeat protein
VCYSEITVVAARGLRVAVLLLLSTAAVSQEPRPFNPEFKLVPNTIASIPALAQAVLTGDREQVIKGLQAGDDVNAKVLATDGARAGFTPLILAATISKPDLVQLLIEHKAKVTILDDFHRSAFWYAALRGSVSTTTALVSATDVKEVINEPDGDLKRTPLHLAVRLILQFLSIF